MTTTESTTGATTSAMAGNTVNRAKAQFALSRGRGRGRTTAGRSSPSKAITAAENTAERRVMLASAQSAPSGNNAQQSQSPADGKARKRGRNTSAGALGKQGGHDDTAAEPITATQPGTSPQPTHPDLAPIPAGKGKQGQIIALLRRPEGATIAELMAATGWMSHSVRGALSGALKRKLGLAVQSTVEPERGRVYRLGAEPVPTPAAVTPADSDPATPPAGVPKRRAAAAVRRRATAAVPGEAS